MLAITNIKIVGSLVAVLILMTMLSDAFAFHYSGKRWLSSTVSVTYDLNGLNTLKDKNGNIIGWQVVSAEIDKARGDWNSLPSVFTLDRITSSDHIVTATSMGRSGTLAAVTCSWFIWIWDCDMKFNNDYSWTTTNSGSEPYTISAIARHEWGHFVMFDDVYDRTDTVMYGHYNINILSKIWTVDSNELSDIYG